MWLIYVLFVGPALALMVSLAVMGLYVAFGFNVKEEIEIPA